MVKLVKPLVLFTVLFAVLTSGFTLKCGSETINPSNNKSLDELVESPEYWNSWTNAIALKQKAKELALIANQYHQYVKNEYDCNDMAVDIWNMLGVGGDDWEPIKSVIVIGNLDEVKETYDQCNHAWLIILNKPPGGFVTIYALEPTNGLMYRHTGNDADVDPNAKYFEGFFYANPSGLREDLGDRW
ncbi:MAG: hypothetical protein HN929_13000 [Chloroflexi bacterium]|jgi:hypothetical protein|nr:hypothetical protein [Chloroflexota bacterium]MBT7082356.1 hypothetical protein [Chloroflexota bacterium]MBT7289098.1 hypothetical protein [Chloroflexota bacterium]